jgi:uncharacterized repeat protein (TIGR01451 family)
VAAGSTVTFTYVVTNTGNVPLDNVVVTDDQLGTIAGPASGDTNNNGLLDTNETWIYTKTATAQAGQHTNVGTVTGTDANNPAVPPVTDDNPGNYFGDAPGIQIVKLVNGQDADTPTGPHVPVGSTVTFTYVVTNTGNVPLSNVVVTDDQLGPITSFTGDTNNNGLLDLTETWTYTKTATALAGQQTNVGTVTGQDVNNPPGTTVTDENPANYFGDAPGIQIVKLVNGQDADTPPGPHVAAGSTVTFTYVVTNTGNVPLANVVVTDDQLGTITSFTGDTNGNGLLDLTETWTYTKTATAQAGQHTNVGTVTAKDPNIPNGPPVTDNNPGNYFGDAPGIQIVKFVNGQNADSAPGPHVPAGSTLTFTYVVTNTGNVPLANVVVTDDQLGTITSFTGDTNGNGLLDTNETWLFTKTATAQAGQHTNVGTVTGQDADNPTVPPVTDHNPANYFGDVPGIKIVKLVNGQDADTPPGQHLSAGSTLTFTYVVTNTGNVPLANVVVTDDKLGTITSFTGDTNNNGLLDTNETWTYTKTATAQVGQQTNTGTVTARDTNTGTTVTDDNPANYFGNANPTITTSPNPTTGLQGGTLQDVANLTGGLDPTGSITFRLFAPGVDPTVGPATYTETVTVSGNGTYHTNLGFAANAAGTWHWVATYNSDMNNSSASNAPLDEPVTILPTVDLEVTKVANHPVVAINRTVVYTIRVVNHGPGTASGVVVSEVLPPGLVFVSASASQGAYNPATKTWSVGTLANGAEATLQIVARVRRAGRLVNVVVVSSMAVDTNQSNNQSAVVIRGMTAKQVSKRLFLSLGGSNGRVRGRRVRGARFSHSPS